MLFIISKYLLIFCKQIFCFCRVFIKMKYRTKTLLMIINSIISQRKKHMSSQHTTIFMKEWKQNQATIIIIPEWYRMNSQRPNWDMEWLNNHRLIIKMRIQRSLLGRANTMNTKEKMKIGFILYQRKRIYKNNCTKTSFNFLINCYESFSLLRISNSYLCTCMFSIKLRGTKSNIMCTLHRNFCLFAWFSSCHTRMFYSYVDVTIAGEGLPILTNSRH